MCKLTSQHHSAKHSVIPVQRAAVPAVMSELVLALFDPLFGSLTNGLHQVWVPLAELPLLVHQARNVVTDHPCTQRSDVPAVSDAPNCIYKKSKRKFHNFYTENTFKRCSTLWLCGSSSATFPLVCCLQCRKHFC